MTAVGAGGFVITLFVAVGMPRLAGPIAASATRDWIPYLLLLMIYWQAGQFVTRTDVQLEARLERWDRKLVAPLLQWCGRNAAGAWILAYLELAYLFCYISMPAGLGALYWLRGGTDAGHFWTVVLLSAYTCYCMVPFIQTRPPRMLGEEWNRPLPASKLRALNLWILRHASIHANTFPSAHVASTAACALILLRFGPAWLGVLFLLIALSVALGAVAGRYHYAADAIFGAAVAIAAFLFANAMAPTHRIIVSLIEARLRW